jgi:hypothetical protein
MYLGKTKRKMRINDATESFGTLVRDSGSYITVEKGCHLYNASSYNDQDRKFHACLQ